MRFEEYRRYDAVALAGLLNMGELSAGELLDVAIARAETVNPKINAIVHKQYERARATVNKTPLNGPLAGVPYLIKDLATFEADEPARLGSSLYADFIADHDSSYTARCKRAGLVPGSGFNDSSPRAGAMILLRVGRFDSREIGGQGARVVA